MVYSHAGFKPKLRYKGRIERRDLKIDLSISSRFVHLPFPFIHFASIHSFPYIRDVIHSILDSSYTNTSLVHKFSL